MDAISKVIRNLNRDVPRPALQATRETERGEWLQRFCDRLNPERLKAPPEFKLKPLTIKRMAFLLTGVPTADLHAFWKACESAKNFSKFFWWRLSDKKQTEFEKTPNKYAKQ